MLEQIRAILKEYVDVPEGDINVESTLQLDLGLNSLDVVNLVVEFEEQFGIEIKDDDIRSFITIGDMMEYIQKQQS